MDDEALLAASAEGDADAFAAFYRRHLGLVVAFCLRATGDREVAADLSAEVFAAALSACGRYRAQYETAAPWLIGIAHNKLRESQRRAVVQDGVRRRLRMRPLEYREDDLERVEMLASAAEGEVLAAVEDLPEAEREAAPPTEAPGARPAMAERCAATCCPSPIHYASLRTRTRSPISKQAEPAVQPLRSDAELADPVSPSR